jgi:hypothetical protein
MHSHQLGASPAGSVMLDIGVDAGVLIIHATAEEHLLEIEISPGVDPTVRRAHAAVRERILPDRVVHAAVYPGLPTGTYTIWRNPTMPHGTAVITASRVTDYQWERAGSSH